MRRLAGVTAAVVLAALCPVADLADVEELSSDPHAATTTDSASRSAARIGMRSARPDGLAENRYIHPPQPLNERRSQRPPITFLLPMGPGAAPRAKRLRTGRTS